MLAFHHLTFSVECVLQEVIQAVILTIGFLSSAVLLSII